MKKKIFFRFTRFFALVLMCLIMSGCEHSATQPDYREYPFFAEIRYESEKTVFFANVTVGGESENAEVPRDIEVIFTAPPSINGLRVVREGGIMTIERSSVQVTSDASALRFLHVAEMMIAEGEMKFLYREKVNGVSLHKALILDDGGDIEIYIDESGNPKKFSRGSYEITVIRFEKRES